MTNVPTGYFDMQSAEPTMPDRTNSFTMFNMLPPELRLMIWECAMDEPRIVDIEGPKFRSRFRDSIYGVKVDHLAHPRFLRIDGDIYQQVPELFFVNRESRRLAMRRYTTRLSGDQIPNWPHSAARCIISRNDIIIDGSCYYFGLLPSSEGTVCIRNLAFISKYGFDIRNCLTELHRLKSDLATTNYRLGATVYRYGRHTRLTRRSTRLKNRIRQAEYQIEGAVESLVHLCVLRRLYQNLDKVERWIVLLGDASWPQLPNLVLLGQSGLAPNFWQRQENNKNSEDPEARATAVEAAKLAFARC
ncbi:hypothetical protein F4819DRAFT_485447 [Hypoxylon fuscum]|nr:hypothetical protein F4819DRAFT_485447 [Hypoxylon fuscum]